MQKKIQHKFSGNKNIWDCAKNGDLDEIIYQIENGFKVTTKVGWFARKSLFDVASSFGHIEILAYLTSFLSFDDHEMAQALLEKHPQLLDHCYSLGNLKSVKILLHNGPFHNQ